LFIVLAVAAVWGAGLAAIQPGSFLPGWGGISVLLALGLSALLTAWRWAGAGKTLAWMTALALLLRLAAGVAVYIALPRDGYNEPDDKAGYVFTDAHRRDDQAWQLASSGKPLWAAFDKSYYTDQYGGLLALSAISYRIFSPDSHRPLVVLALAAMAAALGVPFFARATALIGEAGVSRIASWIYVVYPESVLTGGAQMREPFLLTLIAMTLWGFAAWTRANERRHLIWVALGMVGLLIVSPAIALTLLVVLAVWLRLPGARVHLSWRLVLAAGAVLLAGVAFLAWSLGSRDAGPGFPLGIILNWVRDSVTWVIYQLERGSGQIQNVFSKLGAGTQFLFVVGYGITQPVLPPALLEPTTLTWHVIAIFRSLGWYVVLPLLVYAPVAVRGMAAGGERRVWTWIVAFCWIWIVICSIRAGGSQWDNPRYRLIFLGFQALAAAFAMDSWRKKRDGWLPRILLAEILCLAVFGQWYLARYQHIGIHFPIMVVLGLSITGVLLILASGPIWERVRRRT
jgi:hypothetical protein